MRRTLLSLALLLVATPAWANEPIRFARTPDVSHDGKLVAFSYLGDIWVVPSAGGTARQLTSHEAHDVHPAFSPDGRKIAFSSNRDGNYDIYAVPVDGGKPFRVTYDSGIDQVCGWSPDGTQILFSSSRLIDFPPRNELFVVAASGGQPRQVSAWEGREGAFSPDGKRLALVRGPAHRDRKGYRGSSNEDIWVSDAAGKNNKRLTTHAGHDNSPAWSADGRYLYYVSDVGGGAANVVRQEVAGPDDKTEKIAVGDPKPVTFHKDAGVRKARLSANGDWLAYECGADLWLAPTKGGPPRKLVVEANADEKSSADRTTTFTSGATEMAVSPDERHIAFAVQGDLFLVPRAGGAARRLTDHPAQDSGIAWAPDGKSLMFLSDRDGQVDVYRLDADDPDHPDFARAHKFKSTRVTDSTHPEAGLNFTPDGKRISFLRGGKLVTATPEGKDEKILFGDGVVIDYEFSPNGKWVCCSRMDGHFASELFVLPATGPTAMEPARNVTRYATYNVGPTWSKTGNKLAFVSERRFGGTGATPYVLSLQKPAAAGASSSEEIDWDGIHLRATQVVSASVGEAVISRDGAKIAFRSRTPEEDLWVANSDGSIKRLTTNNTRPTQITWSKLFSGLIFFLDGTGNLRMVNLTTVGTTASVGAVTIPFKAKMTIHRDAEFLQMFDQSWRMLNDQFYDVKFHGADWKAVRERYRPLVKHVAVKEDLYALVGLMIGELNASHLGISGPVKAGGSGTAELGLVFDSNYAGPGLKIAEILKGGPADRRGISLKPGDVVVSLDDAALTDRAELGKLLQDKVGEGVVLRIAIEGDLKAAPRRVELIPTSRAEASKLTYERWVDANAKRVGALSKGKLGYIHIPSMDDVGLERFMRSLYSDNYDREALVLDVRFNGGGFTHDKVLNYLGGKDHTFFHHRQGPIGTVIRAADRKWNKPLVLLVNNRSFSDAEIFPSAFRTLGLGKLVGQATGGFVIGTINAKLIDGSMFRLPRTGVFTAKGVNMDKEGVRPDVEVEPQPDDLARGLDAQLDRAVEVVLEELKGRKK